jgi:hypothetical protein
MDGDLSLVDKIGIDFKLLKALIYHYTKIEGIIKWETWEKIIARSCDGEWISGDKYMADAIKSNYGFNIKSVKKPFSKTKFEQYIDYIQCRVPIQNESSLTANQIGDEIIKTLITKKNESFDDLNIDTMIDVIIVHNRFGDDYNIRMFFDYQPDYSQYNYTWIDNCGYIDNDKKWKFKRNKPDKYGQTRLNVKSKLSLSNCDLDFKVVCPVKPDPTEEELLSNYDKYVNTIRRKS